MNDTMVRKHTPGPWTLQEHESEPCQLIGNGTIHIADVYATDFPVGAADAALIAAAPELLEALRVLADHAQEQYPHFESERGQRDIAQALAAIAKAVQS